MGCGQWWAPGLRFNSFGRAPSPYYPDYRRLAGELDRDGKQASFLATEANFAVVKDLEDRNLVISVDGNFAGPTALKDVAEWMVENHEHLSAFYTSNVEQYLYRDGGFAEFAKSVAKLTRNSSSVFIRSCFTCSGAHPQAVSGYHVVMMTQHVAQLVSLRAAGQLGSHGALRSDPTACRPPSRRRVSARISDLPCPALASHPATASPAPIQILRSRKRMAAARAASLFARPFRLG